MEKIRLYELIAKGKFEGVNKIISIFIPTTLFCWCWGCSQGEWWDRFKASNLKNSKLDLLRQIFFEKHRFSLWFGQVDFCLRLRLLSHHSSIVCSVFLERLQEKSADCWHLTRSVFDDSRILFQIAEKRRWDKCFERHKAKRTQSIKRVWGQPFRRHHILQQFGISIRLDWQS